MKSTVVRRLAILVIVLAALAAVAVIAYQLGANNNNEPAFRGGLFRGGMMGGWGYGAGAGLFGLIGVVLVGVLVVWVFAAVVSHESGSRGPAAPAPGDLDRLTALSEMHSRGELTDEEFSAAKRKLLGLQ